MNLGGKKILVVEDELPLLKVLTDSLSDEGFDVIGAKDGQEGLELALKNNPDLVLLDILMPKVDGIEVLRKLKNNSQTNKIPVILLTNLGETSRMLEAKQLGVEDYLIKSNFKIDEVVKIVKDRLEI